MHDYGFKVVLGGRDLAQCGFDSFVGHPFIFDPEPGYARLPNQFLIDRRLGVWDPVHRGSKRNPSPPARQSLRNYAYWLCNALEWAHARGVDLMNADYSSVLIGRYQQEMLQGIWSASKNTPLKGNTANVRVQIALEYQMWAADKGLRDSLTIPTVTRTYTADIGNSSGVYRAKSIECRKGKAKVSKQNLAFPADNEIRDWLDSVYRRPICGPTEGLIAELILNTAIRLQEAACFRIDTLPIQRKDWKIINPNEAKEFQSVAITIKYGTKGRHDGEDEYGDTIGPEGNIKMPLWLAERIHHYRQTDRLLSLRTMLKAQRSIDSQKRFLEKSVHLFIHPITGKRYKDSQIYYFWKLAEGPPHWSPHLGRDWWACRYLEERMKEHAELIKHLSNLPNFALDHPLFAALKDSAQAVIQLEIQPQLRHKSAKTTHIYLQWLFSKMHHKMVNIY